MKHRYGFLLLAVFTALLAVAGVLSLNPRQARAFEASPASLEGPYLSYRSQPNAGLSADNGSNDRVAVTVTLSEVRIDQPGSDTDEYFELAGPASTSLDGYTYLVIGDGASNNNGVIEAVVPLTGTAIPSDGYFLAAESTLSPTLGTADLTASLNFENSDNVTHLLVQGFTGSNGDDLDTDDDGVLDVTPWSSISDCVGLVETSGTGDKLYCSTTVGPDGSYVPGHVYLCQVGWQIGSFTEGVDDTPGSANACAPDLAVVKTGPNLGMPGGVITYSIAYSNTGLSDATGVVVSDTLPSGTSYLSDDSGMSCPACAVGATGVVTWNFGTVPLSGQGGFTLTLAVSNTVPFGSGITNTVAITATNGDGDATDNQAQWPTSVSSFDLLVSKSGPEYAVIGENLTYTITLENRGVATATEVIVTDTLPLSVTYVADNSHALTTTVNSGVVVWEFGDLISNTIETIQLTATMDVSVTAGRHLTNTMVARSSAPGDNPANNTAQLVTTVFPMVTIRDVQFVPDPASNDDSPYAGKAVWVEGVVVAEPGEIDTPSRAMVIEDPAGGPWSGLEVYRASGLGVSAPEGTLVRVLGTVAEYNGMTELSLNSGPYAIQIISTGNPVPAPQVLATSDFDEADAAGSEQWESVLIEFQNASVTNASLGYGEWRFDDGSGPARADDLGEKDGDLTYLPANGDTYLFIRGIGWYSYGKYKLVPRYDADISQPPKIHKAAPVVVTFGDLFTYTITLDNLLGYDLTGVVVTDVVPSNATFAYALDGGVESGGVVSWTAGTVTGSLSVRFAVTATNSITVTSNQIYGFSSSNYTTTFGAPIATSVLSSTQIAIHHIQGSGHLSPFAGTTVQNIHGIVTAVDTNGFYMQTPDSEADGNLATSEGIFVYTSSSPGVNIGDEVRVDGGVQEYYPGGAGTGNLPTTRLTGPTVVVSSTGNTLPAPIVIGTGGRIPPDQVIDDDGNTTFDPLTDGLDFYESLEGMLVQINNALVVGPTTRYGEFAVVGDLGSHAGTLSARNGIVIQAGDFNPERLIFDDGIVFSEPDVLPGDTFTKPITAVVDYSFGNFKFLNPVPLPAVIPGGLISETTALTRTDDQILVATMNVENLDPGDTNFNALADEIVNHLNAPDIIGVQEVQDNSGPVNDGTVDASQTYGALIAAITSAGGPTYEFREIAPLNNQDGGQPGGNIRVGFLFRTDRGLQFIDRGGATATSSTVPINGSTGVELSYSPGRIDPTNSAFNNSRKPLAGEFMFHGNKLFVVVAHFNSKGGDGPLFGMAQPPFLGSQAQRLQQAQVVNNFVDDILTLDSQAKVIVLGDLNDFQFSAPLATLKGGVLVDLIANLPVEEQYTFVYDSNSQVLDHILVTNLMSDTAVMGFDVVHMNAEFLDDTRPTDHDPSLALLELPPGYKIYMPLIFKGATTTGTTLSREARLSRRPGGRTLGAREVPVRLAWFSSSLFLMSGLVWISKRRKQN